MCGVLAGWIGWNDGLAATRGEPIAQLAGIVGPIGDQPSGQRGAPQECSSADQVVGVARRDRKGDGAAVLVCYRVNLGRPSAARASDGMGEGPPFAPAAERCALTWVESIAADETTPLDPLSA